MSRDKQRLEIKKCIDAVYGADCTYFDVGGFAIADEIYNAGYRKASEVAREIAEEIQDMAESYGGGVLFWQKMRKFAAELKKKYTGEGK